MEKGTTSYEVITLDRKGTYKHVIKS